MEITLAANTDGALPLCSRPPWEGAPLLNCTLQMEQLGHREVKSLAPWVAQWVSFREKTQGSLMRVRALEAIRESLA